MKRGTTAVLCAGLMMFVGATAWADAVGPKPTDCMTGTRGATCHGGEYCRPDNCTTNADCDPGENCEPLALCLGTIDCSGGWTPDAAPSLSTTVEDACPDGTCTSGTCSTEMVCVAEVVDPPPNPGGIGCACRFATESPAASSAAGLTAVAGLFLGGLVFRRRRYHRSH